MLKVEPRLIHGYRHYWCNDGWYPSVTSVLSATPRKRDGSWKVKKIGASNAMVRGSHVHRACENYLNGKTIELPEEYAPFWRSVQPVLDRISAVTITEQFVSHGRVRYGGTLDAVVQIDGATVLLDWKTTNNLATGKAALKNYRLQVIAYAAALSDCKNIIVDRCGIVLIHPDGPAEIHYVGKTTMANGWIQFKGRRAEFAELMAELSCQQSNIVETIAE